jgi:hypothetical protein
VRVADCENGFDTKDALFVSWLSVVLIRLCDAALLCGRAADGCLTLLHPEFSAHRPHDSRTLVVVLFPYFLDGWSPDPNGLMLLNPFTICPARASPPFG